MSGAVEGVALLPEPEDLRPWGYAPGSYVFKCQDCPPDLSMYDRMGKLGDKRAWRCQEHAIMARDAAPAVFAPLTTPPDLTSGDVEGCPFCGSMETGLYRPTEAREGSGWHDWFVRCHQCHVESAEYETKAEAITAWNTRTTPPARSYADAIEDAAKVADMFADHWLRTAEAAPPGPNRSLRTEIAESHRLNAAEIRLLSQGGRA